MVRTKVTCEKCGREISKSNFTKHLRSHETYSENYKKSQYHLDHDDLFCKFCGKEYKNKNSLVQHEVRCKENPNKINVYVSNFNNIGHTAWNKGLTKETDERVTKCLKTYKQNKALGLHKDRSGSNNPGSNTEVKEKISKTCLNKSKDGTWHTSLAKNMHYNYKGNDLHGTWELRYAIFLDHNNINWIRTTDRFEYFYNGKIHYYTPDFYIIDTDEYIEIKGYINPNGKDHAKWAQFPEDKKLKVLKYKDLMELNIFNVDISNYIKFKLI